MGSPAPQSADDALSPEEEALLQEIMAMEQQPQQQPPMQQQPQPSMAVGGVVKAAYGISVGGGGNLTRDIAIGGNKPKVTTGTDTGTTTTTTTGKKGMFSVFYIHPDGRRLKVLLLNGKPIGKVPDDFLDFVTDTPENRIAINFQMSEETTVDASTGTATGAGTTTGAGTKTPSDDDSNERYEPGGNLYKGDEEPYQPTFENIGINGSDPAAGADAALNRGQGFIVEALSSFPLAPVAIVAGTFGSVQQAEIISIAHANALLADRQNPLKDGTSIVGNAIRDKIKIYERDNSSVLADIITGVAAFFVKKGKNRLDDFDALGGLAGQTADLSDSLEVADAGGITKAQQAVLDAQKAKDDLAETQRLVAERLARLDTEFDEKDDSFTSTDLDKALADAGKINKTTQQVDEQQSIPVVERYQTTATGKDYTTTAQKDDYDPFEDIGVAAAFTPKPYEPPTVQVDEDDDYGYADAMNKGGLIARPKKKTKKKKK